MQSALTVLPPSIDDTLLLVDDSPTSPRKRLGDILVDRGVITFSQLSIALRQQKAMRERGVLIPIGEILVSLRFADVQHVEEAINLGKDDSYQGGLFTASLPQDICLKYSVHPLRVNGNTLAVQAARKLSSAEKTKILQACRTRHVTELKIIASEKTVVARELARYQESDASLDSWIRKLRIEITGAALKGFMDNLLMEATSMRASDIHLDRGDDYSSWVIYRVDGDLMPMHLLPTRLMAAIITRIKSESGMDASETRRPQDGRMSLESRNKKLDVRVASQPIASGETLSLRLLNISNMRRIAELFAAQPHMLSYLNRMTKIEGKAGGLVLVSGATGSGKSTTIYAVAQELERDRLNVMTVEDPVEYILPFARQIQINQLLEQRATDMERSLLRQDPDVVIFGELRDENFAQAAFKLTESGHFCFSTVHANDAYSTFERVLSVIGEKSRGDALFVMVNYIKAVINQRLVKRLCTCATNTRVSDVPEFQDTARMLKLPPDAPIKVRCGCSKCNNTGYFGRIIAHDSLLVPEGDKVRQRMREALAGTMDFSRLSEVKEITYISRAESLRTLVLNQAVDLYIADATLKED